MNFLKEERRHEREMKMLEMLKLPWKILKKFRISRVKNMIMYLRTEGVRGTKKRLLECLFGTEIYRKKLVLEKVREISSLEDCEILEFPVYEAPLVSVIVPVYNQFSFTYHCLSSILAAGDKTKYEIIIADDCSTDLTRNITRKVKNIKVVKTESNAGFLKNCNHAAAMADGKYIYFLNNDTQVQSGWLDAQVQLMERDSEIGMTGAKLVYPDGRLQEAGGIIWQDGSAANYGNRKDPFLPEYNYVREVDYISGAAIMIRRSLWQGIGGFDERYAPAYCEDSDLAFSVRKAGYKVMYQPESVVVHFEGVSNGTDTSGGIKAYQVKNREKLCLKWREELKQQFLPGENEFRARERSGGKKVFVMMDHTIPSYDQDAGSRTEYQFIRLFKKKGFVVKFIPGNFHYTLPYVKEFQQMGVEVLYGENNRKNNFHWLEENKENIDYVFLNRPDFSCQYIDYFKDRTSCKILYYGHDFHYMRNMREYEMCGDIKKKEEAEVWLKQEISVMRKADISYYPSEAEVQQIKNIDKHLRVRSIGAFVYEGRSLDGESFSVRKGLLFVGGFRHTPNQDGILWFANEIYPFIREKMEISLTIVGSNAPKKIMELSQRPGIKVLGYVSDEELEELYQKCRVIIAPLRYGAGVKGKVIEAMYYGVPVVTTHIGIEGIPDTEIIPVEDDAYSFARMVMEVYQKEDIYNKLRQQERQIVRKHFSDEALWDRIADDFNC